MATISSPYASILLKALLFRTVQPVGATSISVFLFKNKLGGHILHTILYILMYYRLITFLMEYFIHILQYFNIL